MESFESEASKLKIYIYIGLNDVACHEMIGNGGVNVASGISDFRGWLGLYYGMWCNISKKLVESLDGEDKRAGAKTKGMKRWGIFKRCQENVCLSHSPSWLLFMDIRAKKELAKKNKWLILGCLYLFEKHFF